MMEKLVLCLSILILGAFTPVEARAENLEVSFAVLTDAQYADVANPSGTGSRHYAASLKKLDACVRSLNSLKPQFVIQLGDMIDRDFTSFDPMLSHYNQLTMPHYNVLGNHDFNYQSSKKPDTTYRKLGLKKNYYDFRKGNWRFIVLDGNDIGFLPNAVDPTKCQDESQAIDKDKFTQAQAMMQKVKDGKGPNAYDWNGGIGWKQIEWLKSRLDKASDAKEKVIIFCHFPIYPTPGVCNLWNDDEMLKVVDQYKCVKAWINGHEHGGNYGVRNGVHYITLQGMVETADQNAYALIRAYPNRLEVTGFGRVPTRVLMLE